MFSLRLQDIEGLKARIRQEVRNLAEDILRGVTDTFGNRLQQYIVHLMDIIFKNYFLNLFCFLNSSNSH